MSPPSHTTAATAGGTQQCDKSAKLGAPIARVKANFRQQMRRQIRYSLTHQKGKRRGVVKFSQIARMLEIALESWDGNKAEELNESVGYFINEEGYMDWDITRNLDTSTITDDPSAVLGDVGSSRTGWRAAQDQKRADTNKLLEQTEREIAAATKATATAYTAAVPEPTLTVPRARPRSLNANGLCLTAGAHVAELEAVAEEAAAKEKEKENRHDQFWDNWRSKIKNVESTLELQNTPKKKCLIVEKHLT